MRQRIVLQTRQYIGKTRQGAELVQRLLPGNEAGLSHVLPPGQLTLQLARSFIADAILQEQRYLRRAIPIGTQPADIIQGHVQARGQGEGDADHQPGHGAGNRVVEHPLHTVGGRQAVVLQPGIVAIAQAGTAQPGTLAPPRRRGASRTDAPPDQGLLPETRRPSRRVIIRWRSREIRARS